MQRLLVLVALLAGLLALAPTALAGTPRLVTTVELVRQAEGQYQPRHATPPFTLAGLRWQGPGRVVFRTRVASGRWSRWRAAAPEPEDGPDLSSPETRDRAWRNGNPWWVGLSTGIEARATGSVSRVEAHLVWSPETRIPLRVPTAADEPAIVPRATWGADESIRRAPPVYAPEVRLAVVHHTAGRNDYSRAEAAAIVKGIQLFHVQGNGWNDIGYNFLVDRFGTVYEGRYGGVDRNVVGAHALGFNTGSVGIALLGTYGDTVPSKAAQDAIARLVAWRLDLAHVDPVSLLTFVSGGSDKWAAGLPVLLGAVSGHRDTGYTECPGDALYARLGAIAAAARGIGGAKLFAPGAEARGLAVRFTATVSSALPWAVVITSSDGTEVARGTGSGTTLDWTWDSTGTPPGSYRWTISAGDARPATGVLRAGGGAAPLQIESAVAQPEAISPNGDGQADAAVLTYRITAPANVTVEITDEIGSLLATVVDRVWTRAGEHSTEIDGSALPDGRYNLVLTARTTAGVSVQKVVPLTVSRTLGLVSVAPAAFSPNGDGRKDRITVGFSLTLPAFVRIRVVRDGRWVATPLASSLLAGTQRFVWNGARRVGRLRDGTYTAVVEADDGVAAGSYGMPFSSDTTPPRVRILPGPRLLVDVSEPAVLTFRIDGRPYRYEATRSGIVVVPWRGPATRVRVVARDGAGNVSAPVLRVSRPR